MKTQIILNVERPTFYEFQFPNFELCLITSNIFPSRLSVLNIHATATMALATDSLVHNPNNDSFRGFAEQNDIREGRKVCQKVWQRKGKSGTCSVGHGVRAYPIYLPEALVTSEPTIEIGPRKRKMCGNGLI
jgi:hypothetical protein